MMATRPRRIFLIMFEVVKMFPLVISGNEHTRGDFGLNRFFGAPKRDFIIQPRAVRSGPDWPPATLGYPLKPHLS